MNLTELGARIEEEKGRLGLKSSEVCTALDIHANTYRNYELGKRDMPMSLLVKLWDVGFDAMYILTGQRMSDLAVDVINNGESYIPSFHQRLVHLPENMDINNPADALMTAMYHAEEALVQVGASANDDYDYKTLSMLGIGLIDKIK